MKCGFCLAGVERLKRHIRRETCYACGVSYYDWILVDFRDASSVWWEIPKGCLLVMDKWSEGI